MTKAFRLGVADLKKEVVFMNHDGDLVFNHCCEESAWADIQLQYRFLKVSFCFGRFVSTCSLKNQWEDASPRSRKIEEIVISLIHYNLIFLPCIYENIQLSVLHSYNQFHRGL